MAVTERDVQAIYYSTLRRVRDNQIIVESVDGLRDACIHRALCKRESNPEEHH